MRARIVRILAAMAAVIGASGAVAVLTASPASAQYIGGRFDVHLGSATELYYEDTSQYATINVAVLSVPGGASLATFAEVGESAPDYELGPVASLGTFTDGQVVNVAVTRVGLTGSLPVLIEPATCHLDANLNGECDF